jgi:hypothetical protein
MSVARWLSFYWSVERQEICVDGERFAHPIATNTQPSHDVCHLLVAASGLPWRPSGSLDQVTRAEFGAVLLEHLGVNVLNAVLGRNEHCGDGDGDEGDDDVVDRGVLAKTLEHTRWFLNVHWASTLTFPAELDRFCEGLDLETVVTLSPVFFRTRLFELAHEDYRERTLSGAFSSNFAPTTNAALREVQGAFGHQVEALVEWASDIALARNIRHSTSVERGRARPSLDPDFLEAPLVVRPE